MMSQTQWLSSLDPIFVFLQKLIILSFKSSLVLKMIVCGFLSYSIYLYDIELEQASWNHINGFYWHFQYQKEISFYPSPHSKKSYKYISSRQPEYFHVEKNSIPIAHFLEEDAK